MANSMHWLPGSREGQLNTARVWITQGGQTLLPAFVINVSAWRTEIFYGGLYD
ncbi:MAG: hypothetical protein LBQ77_03055 [Treponema sp.]|jgi:hypothetical protein|nr:hypothetical protein [Treponema sp.]